MKSLIDLSNEIIIVVFDESENKRTQRKIFQAEQVQ